MNNNKNNIYNNINNNNNNNINNNINNNNNKINNNYKINKRRTTRRNTPVLLDGEQYGDPLMEESAAVNEKLLQGVCSDDGCFHPYGTMNCNGTKYYKYTKPELDDESVKAYLEEQEAELNETLEEKTNIRRTIKAQSKNEELGLPKLPKYTSNYAERRAQKQTKAIPVTSSKQNKIPNEITNQITNQTTNKTFKKTFDSSKYKNKGNDQANSFDYASQVSYKTNPEAYKNALEGRSDTQLERIYPPRMPCPKGTIGVDDGTGYRCAPIDEAKRGAYKPPQTCDAPQNSNVKRYIKANGTSSIVNYDERQEQGDVLPRAVLGTVDIIATKVALGAQLPTSGEFTFGLFDDTDTQIMSTTNDANGLIVFQDVEVTQVGSNLFTIKEISGPAVGWDLDATEWPVQVDVVDNGDGTYSLSVDYSISGEDLTPHFINTHQSNTCGLVEFPELTFDTPGVYTYKIKELSVAGSGWDTDDSEYTVTITVTDDGFGNFFASAEYKNDQGVTEYPEFVDVYTGAAAKYVISACKSAVGSSLPENRFQFGLFKADGTLIDTATNAAADPVITAYNDELIRLARRKTLSELGTVYGDIAVSRVKPERKQIPAKQVSSCDSCKAAVERKLTQMRELLDEAKRNEGKVCARAMRV